MRSTPRHNLLIGAIIVRKDEAVACVLMHASMLASLPILHMCIRSMLARAVVLQFLSAQFVPFALAQSGGVLIDETVRETSAQTEIGASSANDVNVVQEGGSGAVQEVEIDAEAETVVNAEQTVHAEHDVGIEQTCEMGSGNALCIEDAAPVVVTEAEQVIDARASNDLGIDQHAGSGSMQTATASGSALTDVNAAQNVRSDVIVDIFQDCSMQHGVCVQRALPEVLTRATQVIAASALNTLVSAQRAGTGSTQEFQGDLAARVNVNAEQFVSPRTFLALTQLCAIDVGMCVQRAAPLVHAAVEQVIDAQAHNDADILQDGAHEATANLHQGADTNVASTQRIESETTLEIHQECGVGKGLCLRVDSSGNPTYVFTDGESTTTGDYTGTLDETVLQGEYSRRTVGLVASGICGGASSCSMVDRLLLWLFGPEPAAEEPSAVSAVSRDRSDGNYGRRGQQTNVIGASVRFLAEHLRGEDDFAPPAFGGFNNALTPSQRSLICSMRTRLLAGENDDGVWDWTALEIARLSGLSPETAGDWLRNEAVCPSEDVAAAESTIEVTLFPVSHDGPVSGNALWNACVRGERITLEQVRANPDRDEDGLPRTCGSYHTGSSWYHPDLSIFFTWDRETGSLRLPDGYVPAPAGLVAADDRR